MTDRRLVVEADGGSRGNPGPAAYGAVVRDAGTGAVLTEVAEHIGRTTNNVAEYRGLLAGLTAAREIDPAASVEARLDSKLVVEQMSGRWKIRHPELAPLAAAARRVFPPGRVAYTWVPRERNTEADRLANEALDAAARGQPWRRTASGSASASALASASVEIDEAEPEPALPSDAVAAAAAAGTDRGGRPVPTLLLLARHGETEHTAARVFSGSGGADAPLSAVGRRQAQLLAAGLARRGGIDVVVSSPLRRARQTAAAAADALGLPVVVDDRLRECAFGAWEGLTFAEVRERWPTLLAAWLESTAVAPPGGEPVDAVAERVSAFRDEVITRHPTRTVLAVAHVTPVNQLVRLALGAPPPTLFRLDLEPTGLSVVACYPDGGAALRSFNDTGHLR